MMRTGVTIAVGLLLAGCCRKEIIPIDPNHMSADVTGREA